MDDERTDLVPGTLDLLVLTVLAGGALHGYAISERIRATSDDVLVVEEGSLYPALHRMERRGWIEAEWGRSDANRRAKFYRLTPQGRDRLVVREAAWERASAAVARVLAARPGAQGA